MIKMAVLFIKLKDNEFCEHDKENEMMVVKDSMMMIKMAVLFI